MDHNTYMDFQRFFLFCLQIDLYYLLYKHLGIHSFFFFYHIQEFHGSIIGS